MEDIDWNRIWKEKIDKATWNKLRVGKDGASGNFKIARQYHRDSLEREKLNNQTEQISRRFDLNENITVLDIGSGTGVLSVEISKRAREVTAIEPSKPMSSILRSHIEENGISNVKCIDKKWEDIIPFVDVIRHDLVLASFSLTMRDIRDALFKMNLLAKEGVCLFTFAGNPAWDYGALWPILYGEEYDVGPDYIDLYNVLFSMGIHANIEICRTKHIQRFVNLAEAVDFWTDNLKIVSRKAKNILTTYLENQLREIDGDLYSTHDMQSAMIYWNTR